MTTTDRRDEYEARRAYHLRYGPPPLQVGVYDGRLLRFWWELRSATMEWRRL